jgi:hypothetical protein
MIGGKDIVIPAMGSPMSLHACIRVVQRQWPNARFEDAETGAKYSSQSAIPIAQVHQLLAYPNAEAEKLWDDDSPDSPANSMMQLVLGEQSVTVVVDDPNLGEMPAILEGIRAGLEMEILKSRGVEVASS